MSDGSNRARVPAECTEWTSDDPLLTTTEVANILRVDAATLANLRARGEGMPFYKPGGGRPLYKLSDVSMLANGGARGYSRARFEEAVMSWRGPLTTEQRRDLIDHVQTAMWR